MALITAEILSACGVPPEEREHYAETALENKYHTIFEVAEVYPQKFGELYFTVRAYPKDNPQLVFTAAIDTEDDKVSDNYVERLVCESIGQQMKQNLDHLQAYYDLYVHAVGPQPIPSSANITAKEYAALDPQNHFTVELFVLPEGTSTADLYSNVSGMLQDLEYLRGDIRLVVVPDEEAMKTLQVFVEEHETLDIEYMLLIRDFKSCEMPYQNGALQTSAQEFSASVGELS